MKLIIKLLNEMAASSPEEIALTEEGHTISFAGLKHLVVQLSQQLFDDGAGIYGQCIKNETSCRIFALCAEQNGIFSRVVNVPATITKEKLSSTLKTARVQVLYTDVMDKLLETTNTFGPFISLATPIELYHRKIWKVRFRSDYRGMQNDFEEIKLRYRKQQKSQIKKEVYA